MTEALPGVIPPESNPTTTPAAQAAWDANFAAVQDAKALVQVRRRQLADTAFASGRTRRDVMAAVAARGGGYPNADELVRLEAAGEADRHAAEAYQQAIDRHADAIARFKAGVPEELS